MSQSLVRPRGRSSHRRGNKVGNRTLPSKTKRNKSRLKKENERFKSSSEFVYYENKVCEKDGCNEKGRHSISSSSLKSMLVCAQHKNQYSIKR